MRPLECSNTILRLYKWETVQGIRHHCKTNLAELGLPVGFGRCRGHMAPHMHGPNTSQLQNDRPAP